MRKAFKVLIVAVAVGAVIVAWTAIPDCWQWAVSC